MNEKKKSIESEDKFKELICVFCVQCHISHFRMFERVEELKKKSEFFKRDHKL